MLKHDTVNALGGQMVHWTAQAARFQAGDFRLYEREVAGGAAERAKADLAGYEIFDWPISYDDLEPHYERFEWEFGVSGIGGDNPFAAPRKRGFPLPALRTSARMQLFEGATRKLGYHPYQGAAGILSQPYRPAAPYDARIAERSACAYCGHCNFYGCHIDAKSAPLCTVVPVALATGKVDLRTNTRVVRIDADARGRATGVTYLSPDRRLMEQRARVVILAGYAFENIRLLLLSGKRGLANSSGTVGHGVFGHGDVITYGVFDDYIVNAFIGPDSASMRIDDFYGDNFDHAGLGFIRGASIGTDGGGTPVQRINVVPPGMRTWGADYKTFLARAYTRTMQLNAISETLAHRDNVVDLDPDERDEWGVPLPRLTFSFHQNERRLHAFMAKTGEAIMRNTGATTVWSQVPTTNAQRWAGGTRMGADSKISVLNGWCQTHDVANLFVIGASVFPTLTGYPPTETVSALAYRSADYIRRQHEWFR